MHFSCIVNIQIVNPYQRPTSLETSLQKIMKLLNVFNVAFECNFLIKVVPKSKLVF